MAASKVMHGARAKVFIADPNSETPILIGIFHTISWSLQLDVAPVNILGNLNAVELVYTGMNPVSVSCSGFRMVGFGAHAMAKVPNVKDMLTHEYITLQVIDRQDPTKVIGQIRNVRPTGYSTALNARQLEEISVSYTGLWVDDESTTLSERADAATLPG